MYVDFKVACVLSIFTVWKCCYQRQLMIQSLDPFTPSRVSYGDMKEILTFESVDENLWCDHSNGRSPAVLSHGTIYI